jgi:hypothetical protein
MLANGRDTWNSRGGGASWYAEFDAASFNAAEDPAAEDSRGIAGGLSCCCCHVLPLPGRAR